MARQRLDLLLVERGLIESREQAQQLIRAGRVRLDGHPHTKPGKTYDPDSAFTIEAGPRFVSRGGNKLQAALDHWPDLDPSGRVCLDVGASTGGFTDCLLQAGALRVCAVDVGRGQLAWSLRGDSRVLVMEKVNARYLQPGDLPEVPGFFTADVSFISLEKILPAINRVCAPGSPGVTLVKPQFEAGRKQVGRGGVVRDEAVRQATVDRVIAFAESELGMTAVGQLLSPVVGPAGNREFLVRWNLP